MGEFKDDQIQKITGTFSCRSTKGDWDGNASGAFTSQRGTAYNSGSGSTSGADLYTFDSSRVARAGTNTHGKQLGVNYIIKF